MQLKFSKAKWSLDSEGCWLSILVQNRPAVQQFVATKKDKLYSAELKEHRERRSLDANAYFWVLVGKIAAVTGQNKDDVYRQLVKDIGDNYTVVPIKAHAVDRWREIWEGKGIGWPTEILGDSKLDGYVNIINYYGSSAYDKAQMARLIDSTIAECKELDIETATPEELARMKEEWH